LWAWMRYRVKLQGEGPLSSLTREQIPLSCVIIQDLMLPWAHENFLVLQKLEIIKDHFDVWMKVPNNQRFNGQYLAKLAEKMKALLEEKIPDNQCSIVAEPIEARSTFQKMGPPRYPIFSRAISSLRQKIQIGNIYFHSPEFWQSLSRGGQNRHEEKIFLQLRDWWDHKEELRIKRELKEAMKQKSKGAEL
jgi:hypothetical protein